MPSADLDVRLATLRGALAEHRAGALAIPLGGYPDPDAMASGWALAEIAAREGVTARVLRAYPVSHAENRFMVQALGVPIERYDPADASHRFTAFALVDGFEIDRGFGRLAELPCVAIWDHHEGDVRIRAPLLDVRKTAGAASTIATEYLDRAGVLDGDGSLLVSGAWPAPGGDPRTRLATALLVGIASDTEDYLLAHAADFEASARLVTLANRPLFRRIHRRAYTPSALDSLERALADVRRCGTLAVAWIGPVDPDERDTIPQAADILVSRADLDTVVVFGQVGATLDGSFRTLNPAVHPRQMIVGALGVDDTGRPFGGGREGKGGFRLPLASISPDEVARERDRVRGSFLALADEIPRMA